LECGSALPLSECLRVEQACHYFASTESARALAHSKTLPRECTPNAIREEVLV
jgi:hypothetical protein